MEQKSILALVVLTLIFSPLPLTVVATEPASRQLHPLEDFDIWVDPYSHYTIYYSACKTGARIYGSFEVTYGSDIDFFICDRATYNEWEDGSSVSVYEYNPNVGSASYILYLPSDGIWHLVFDNDDLFFSRHIEGTVYYAAPAAQDGSLMMPLLLALGGIVVLAVIVVAASQHGKQKTQTVTVTTQEYTPQQYAPPSEPITQILHCPNCGRSLEPGPELR